MAENQTHIDSQRAFAVWQVGVVLVLIPGAHLLKNYFGIVDAVRDILPVGLVGLSAREWFVPFWLITSCIHLVGLAAVLWFVRSLGEKLSSLQYVLSVRETVVLIMALFCMGLLVFVFREYCRWGDILTNIGNRMSHVMAANAFERAYWVPGAILAGFCEEIVFRGFAVTALRRLRVPLWGCVVLSSVSFSLCHGLGDWWASAMYFGAGVFYSAVYLWRKSLMPVIIAHTFADFAVILLW
jgi:membrane protease YdiL (CAAX protease family)